jgi:hypothetical protein
VISVVFGVDGTISTTGVNPVSEVGLNNDTAVAKTTRQDTIVMRTALSNLLFSGFIGYELKYNYLYYVREIKKNK